MKRTGGSEPASASSVSEAAANVSSLDWLPTKKKKPKKNSQLYSAFARIVPLCMWDSREQLLGNEAPTRQTGPGAQGMKRKWDECFFKLLFPQKNIFHLIVLCLALIPSMAQRVEPGTNDHSKCLVYIFRIFLLGFQFHALLVWRWL